MTETHGDKIKNRIVQKALFLWGQTHQPSVREIARSLNMSHSAVLYHFGTSEILIERVAQRAVDISYKPVVRKLIVNNNSCVSNLTTEQRAGYFKGI